MNVRYDSVMSHSVPTKARVSTSTKKRKYITLFVAWLFLISMGTTAGVLYTRHLQQQISADIAQQTEARLQAIQEDYTKQLATMKETMTTEMATMQTKVDTLNELLAFAKDSANSNTDNSNKLYTQLEEMKKKLDELKKNLEVLQ